MKEKTFRGKGKGGVEAEEQISIMIGRKSVSQGRSKYDKCMRDIMRKDDTS